MSRSSLEQLWEKSWGESLPSGRPTPAKMDSYYPITIMNVALDEGKPVAYRGYGTIGDYTFVGMAFTKSEYRKKDLYAKLAPPMQGKLIAGISQRSPDFPQSKWVSSWENKGFTINPTDEELDKIFGKGHEEITHHFIRFYRNHPKNTWAIKNTDSIAKWQKVLRKKHDWSKGSASQTSFQEKRIQLAHKIKDWLNYTSSLLASHPIVPNEIYDYIQQQIALQNEMEKLGLQAGKKLLAARTKQLKAKLGE